MMSTKLLEHCDFAARAMIIAGLGWFILHRLGDSAAAAAWALMGCGAILRLTFFAISSRFEKSGRPT